MTAKEAAIDVIAARCRPEDLTLTWTNSSHSVYNALWLRDNDPIRRDPYTGRRLGSVADLPLAPRLHSVDPSPPGHITLDWEDGHTSVYSLPWLKAYDRSLRTGLRPTQLPWMAQPAANFAWCDYAQWVANPFARREWLNSVARDGVAFLRDVPLQQGMVLRVAETLGYVRETNHGRVFDACTTASFAVHTSHPYRDPVPGFRLLHCLARQSEGGDGTLVDGMAAAEGMRALDDEAFAALCQIPIRFRFQDALVDIAAERTLIEVDTSGQFRTIYYDDRWIAPLPLRGPQLKKFYPAYRQLAEMLRDPARQVVYRLQPGEIILLDNTRILHGCTGDVGRLQSCYLDADGLYSSLAVLARQKESTP